MDTLAVSLPDELRRRFEALAKETGKSLEDCLLLAVEEFVETWERHLDDVHQIDEDEVRVVLKAANE